MRFKICYTSSLDCEDEPVRIVDINTIQELYNLPERAQENPDPETKEYRFPLDEGEKYPIMIYFEDSDENISTVEILDYYRE